MESKILTPKQINELNKNGVLIIPSFCNPQEIGQIQFGIYQIIGLLIEQYKLTLTRRIFTPATFDSGYNQLIAANRAYGGEVYDAVKQIPALVQLAGRDHMRRSRIFAKLIRNCALANFLLP